MNDLFSLKGKTALITGATRGIGFAIAQAYGMAGARVFLTSESALDCQEAVQKLAERGIQATPIQADLNHHEEVLNLVSQVKETAGQIDVLVCNAGVATHAGPLATATDDDWEFLITVNLRSMLWLTNALMPAISKTGGGSVILMSSIAGVRGNKNLGLYGISKAGVAQLARNLAVEWGPANIRVNAISPGLIHTDFARSMIDRPDIMEKRLALTPLRRVGTAEEIAAVALLLAASGGAFITGQNIIVDGGTTISDGN